MIIFLILMFNSLFNTEKHIQMVDYLYKEEIINEEYLSKLITYLKSKSSSIPKTLDYIKIRAKHEVYNSHQLKITSYLIKVIIDQFRDISICYEQRIIKIFIVIIKEILRLRINNKFQYSDHQEFLDTFTYFFDKVSIKTYKSEKYIKNILFISTTVTKTVENTYNYRFDFLSEDDLSDVDLENEKHNMILYNDESSTMADVDILTTKDLKTITDHRFDYLFLEIIHILVKLDSIFVNDSDEKYGWVVNSLISSEDFNLEKRQEILIIAIQKAKTNNIQSLTYYTLKYASIKNISNVNILLENLQPNLYPQITLQTNINILERGKSLFNSIKKDARNYLDAKTDVRINECKILVNGAMQVLKSHEMSYLYQKEMSHSFFSIMKMFYSENNYCEKFYSFIKDYIREYFNNNRFSSEIFYYFLKKAIQGKHSMGLTVKFKKEVFSEIEKYYIDNSSFVSNPNLIILLLDLTTTEYKDYCCRILFMIKENFMSITIKSSIKEAYIAKLRASYCETENENLQTLLCNLIKDGIPLQEQYKNLCLFESKKIITPDFLENLYSERNIENLLCDTFYTNVLLPYNKAVDEDVFLTYVKNLNKTTNRILKQEPEEKNKKRHSRIKVIEY